ncbi:SNF2 family DNA/RNA helicase [Ignavibacterium album JCM 16511]|uniref:SNF2 family DNA/RNA helicase n=1 Tax=Ignavibacterium album (strain DSM 19864 / JCM 16511 / NBRC 101810 / Mat9-16) TaxID=945713 RepID=I0AIZ2_IGNAJ|nr:helicase-related protein [Ignavibacterium album]AFH48949.1 SNF2 family DNA/RNA helicase [Ignavibacterium album JCM 16511]
MEIKPGTIIKGNQWPEPIEIKFSEKIGNLLRIVGATTYSNQHIDQLISENEISIIETQQFFNEEPWKVFLALESIRYRFASLYDPLLAMNTSKVDPLPHQIEAVYGYVLKLPRIRFLIADDPGAGKTIMAGLIIKELKLRNIVKRILIVTPGHLKDQWRRELKERFEEKFVVVDRNILDAHYGENLWKREQQIITSIDFAKQDDILSSLSSSYFDLIIVDEAHKMSAYKYGEKLDKTIRYRLGEVLSKICTNLLFLTATPHKGDPDNFRLFLDLLEPGFFSSNEMLMQSIKNKDNPLFIRRLKEDLKDFEGRPLFLPRNVETIAFDLGSQSKKEKDLYNELSKYVETQYNKALNKDKKRNVAFALVILQRRLASSTFALFKSLERRREKLKALLEGAKERTLSNSDFDLDEIEDLSEEDRWQEEEIWETLSLAENKEELEKEIQTIDNLINLAKDIIHSEEEIKIKQLKNSLEKLYSLNQLKSQKKILVFTESRDTLEYLSKKISSWNYKVNVIHGGMKLDDRIKAEKVFKNETDVMVATEAAGEGINLQFCNLMINYDIPWNPNRLEQRMGRIHRYGQQKEVFIYNLVANDTREGKVLVRLFEKLEEIKNTFGNDKVFDVLGEVLQRTNLSQLLIEAAANSRNLDDILKEIDLIIDKDYINEIKESLGESLATRFIDYTRIKEMADLAREHRLIPEYTEAFFKKAFIKAGGKIKEVQQGFIAIDSIPFELRQIAQRDDIIKSYGELLKRYPKITFDKEIAFKNPDAEFVTFGHPLFESLLIWVEENFINSILNGTVFYDPDGNLDGYILFYEGEIKDGTGSVAGKRLFAFYVNKDSVTQISPSIIWDLSESPEPNITAVKEIPNTFTSSEIIESNKNLVTNNCISALNEYKSELLNERIRQAEIKERYGIKSLENFIVKLDGELIEFYTRKDKGEAVDLPIYNKEEQKKEYEKAKEELVKRIAQEKTLTMSMPKFKGIIKVMPVRNVLPSMQSDAEIEKIGMDFVMNFEKQNSRTPIDVSKENLGFDIRSINSDGSVRYIEVKARAGIGDVALTQNEWFKAKRFKDDYYLYVVLNAASNPELYMIQNPADKLKADEKIEVVRYVVSYDEILNKSKI